MIPRWRNNRRTDTSQSPGLPGLALTLPLDSRSQDGIEFFVAGGQPLCFDFRAGINQQLHASGMIAAAEPGVLTAIEASCQRLMP